MKRKVVQKILGGILILLSLMLLHTAAQGSTLQEKDITSVLMLAPLGLYLLFTKELYI